VRIADDYAKLAMKELYYPSKNDKKIIGGESGVAGLAGFIAIMTDEKYKEVRQILKISTNTKILCILTEGATDPDVFKAIIDSKL